MLSYSELQNAIKRLEQENNILQGQKKTVIALNPRSQAFEYIGEPQLLNAKLELNTIDQIIQAIKLWLNNPSNDRLSVQQIFESYDRSGSGEVREQDFKSALQALGVKLRPGEFNKVKDVLDPTNTMYFRYTSIVRELMGIPQRDFMHKAINKLAAVVEGRDLNEDQFRQLVEPSNHDQSMDEPTFKKIMDQCAGPDFQFTKEEIVGPGSLFNSLTGANERTTGIKMKVGDLVKAVFDAVQARLIE